MEGNRERGQLDEEEVEEEEEEEKTVNLVKGTEAVEANLALCTSPLKLNGR